MTSLDGLEIAIMEISGAGEKTTNGWYKGIGLAWLDEQGTYKIVFNKVFGWALQEDKLGPSVPIATFGSNHLEPLEHGTLSSHFEPPAPTLRIVLKVHPEEKRTDPEDGQECFWYQLLEKYEGSYPIADIVDYWNSCVSQEVARRISEAKGVGLRYLLGDFRDEAITLIPEKPDPTFYDLRDAFWPKELNAKRRGMDQRCPRDGRMGCALVDALASKDAQSATHFLSWLWCYSLSVYCSTLQKWADDAELKTEDVFLYCCFFCNNQHRILLEESANGSDDLEKLFAAKLTRIGKMIAMLDTWEHPAYLKRIWTIYEQFTASQCEIQVRVVLPPNSAESLGEQFDLGKAGLGRVRVALDNVHGQDAKASREEDEKKVKSLIERSDGGFEAVNANIRKFFKNWVSECFRDHLESMLLSD